MKDLTLIVWLGQLGMSTALPLGGFVLLAVWLRNQFEMGQWVIWAGVVVGVICAINGFRDSMRAMSRLASRGKKKQEPPVSFNDHD